MPRERAADRRGRAADVLDRLGEAYPDARTELDFGTPFHLLVATILSAQATDVSVNAATPALFARYGSSTSMAAATPEEIEPFIRTIGLYRTKAKNLVASARAIEERFGGEVPRTLDELVTLPGVGRKTANVVLANAFGVPTIAVDTHVGRLARRLGFSRHLDPDAVERDLMKLYPSERWVFLHHALILHGRRVCVARTPRCLECVVNVLCPSRRDDPEAPAAGARSGARRGAHRRRRSTA